MTIKDFIEKKVAIAFTNVEQIKEFAKMCEGHNMVMAADKTDAVEWMKNKPEMLFDGIPLPFLPHVIFGKNKFVFFTYDFKEADMPGGLSWNGNDELNDPHVTEKGWKIVPFEEFKKPAKRKFRCVGYKKKEQNFTIGKVYEVDERGSITCDIGFTYENCPMYGEAGIIGFLSEWYEFEEVFEDGEPKNLDFAHKIEIYYEGEKVTTARMIVNGKVVKEATSRRNPEDKFDFKKGATLAFDRLFKPEKKEFKVGERVICVKDGTEVVKETIGKHGVVLACDKEYKGFIPVEFDEYVPMFGHNCSGAGKMGHCRWIPKDSLKPE